MSRSDAQAAAKKMYDQEVRNGGTSEIGHTLDLFRVVIYNSETEGHDLVVGVFAGSLQSAVCSVHCSQTSRPD